MTESENGGEARYKNSNLFVMCDMNWICSLETFKEWNLNQVNWIILHTNCLSTGALT